MDFNTKISNSISADKVYREQVLLLYKALPTSVVGTFLGVFFVLFILWPVIPHQDLLIWASLFGILTVLRGLQGLLQKRKRPENIDIHQSVILFTTGAMSAALMWAAVSVFLFPVGDPVRQIMLAFILSTTGSVAITNIASMRKVAFSFILIVLIPLSVRFFMAEHETMPIMGIMVLLALLLFLAGASRSNKVIVGNIKLTHEATESLRQLGQSQQKLALHIQNTPLAVIEWDPSLVVTEWNLAAEKIFGFTREEVIGKKASDLIVPEEGKQHVETVRRGLNERTGGLYSINENLTRDGRHILCEWFNTPLVNDMGETIGIASLAQDVTERLRLEKLKNEFVSTVSHELRTPLTSLRGSLGLILGGVTGDVPAKIRELLDVANNNAERLQRLINDILDVQRIEAGQIDYHFDEVLIAAVVDQTILENKGFALQRDITLSQGRINHQLSARIDKERILQVMDNLLSNAIKFSPAGSEIIVEVFKIEKAVRVVVRDQGPGIPDEFIPNLFKQFSQFDASTSRDFAGTGLGLSIAKGIIEQHGGQIDYEPAEGGGSCFYFDVPVIDKSCR